jgi:hypothetical protein
MFDTHHVFGPVTRKLRPVTEGHCAGLLAMPSPALQKEAAADAAGRWSLVPVISWIGGKSDLRSGCLLGLLYSAGLILDIWQQAL